jgi:hypothetical protein
VLTFRIMQDVAIVALPGELPAELPGTDRGGKQRRKEIVLPMNERYVDYAAASTSAHTGEKVV